MLNLIVSLPKPPINTFTFRGVRRDFYFYRIFNDIRIVPDGTPRSIWGYPVCLCPTKRTPGLNELIFYIFRI